jgi:alanine dehydrogenase
MRVGVLLSGAPGVAPALVVVIGAGTVGTAALRMAVDAGAQVTVLNKGLACLQTLDILFGGRITTIASTSVAIDEWVSRADLVVGAALVPGAAAPKLVGRGTVAKMREGSVVVDVAIDQGGCFETSHSTTHADPIYVVDGMIHYAVKNMPGAVPRTSTYALTNATLPFALALADKGTRRALDEDPHLAAGLNVYAALVTHPAVADALGLLYVHPEKALKE